VENIYGKLAPLLECPAIGFINVEKRAQDLITIEPREFDNGRLYAICFFESYTARFGLVYLFFDIFDKEDVGKKVYVKYYDDTYHLTYPVLYHDSEGVFITLGFKIDQ